MAWIEYPHYNMDVGQAQVWQQRLVKLAGRTVSIAMRLERII